jgi:hypothetical protein
LGRFRQEPEPSQVTSMALARCILGKFLGVVCHCFPPPLDVSTSAARCLHIPNNVSAPSSERWNCGRVCCPVILPKWRLFTPFRDLLHAANLRHGTDGFTSPPKESMLKIFSMCVYACANMMSYNTQKVRDQHGVGAERVAHSECILATLKNIKIDLWVFGVSEALLHYLLAAEIHGGHQESITSVTCRISSRTGSRPHPLLPHPSPTPLYCCHIRYYGF